MSSSEGAPLAPSKIWKQMPEDRRLEAARSFWSAADAAQVQLEAMALIAAKWKFRMKTVQSLGLDKKIARLNTLAAASDGIAAQALVSFHLEHKRPMMIAFLDALEIAHEDGLITADPLEAPESGKLGAAVQQLRAAFPTEDVDVYLGMLAWQDPDAWGGLAAASPAAAP